MRWVIVGGLLALSVSARAALAQDPSPQAQPGRITGMVTSGSAASPLPDVTVTIPGTRYGATTGLDGRYAILGVPSGVYRVRATRIGYAPQTSGTVTVPNGESVTADFSLRAQAVSLEDIVTIGYGTQRRGDVTGAIASVSGADVNTAAAPTTTVSASLEGKAAGVQVITASGLPGAGASIRVRGTNSISANSEPLYVIDGVPAMQGTQSTDPTQNPLVTIDPNEVESIDILKDASATSIYGARGANGVVLVTTKRGRRGEDRFSIESSVGTQSVSKQISVLNSQQYRTLRNEALRNALQDTVYTTAQINSAPTYDYQSMILRTAQQQNHTVSFSGGDQKTRYLLSGNLMNQDGIILGTQFRRVGGRVNLDREFNSQFRVTTSLSFARILSNLSAVENGQLAGGSLGILGAMVYDPALPVRSANGQYIQRAVLAEFVNNPVATANELTDRRQENRFIGQASAEYDFGKLFNGMLQGLHAKIDGGANIWNADNPFYAPSYIYQGAAKHGSANIWQGHSTHLNSDNLLTYNRAALGPGSLDAVGGFTVETDVFANTSMGGTNFGVEQTRFYDIGSGADRPTVSSGQSNSALLSWLGRVTYNIADRYILTATGRRDGASVFGANNKWANFPSASFAWRLSQEPFLSPYTSYLSDLKLRLSWGKTGNQAISPYQSLAALSPTTTSVGGRVQIGYAPSSTAPNPDLKWETTTERNAGLDLAFLGGRVSTTMDAYSKRTDDLLMYVNPPSASGFATRLENLGSLTNKGLEFSINTINYTSPMFEWRTGFNIAHNQNRVLTLGHGLKLMETGADRWGWAIGGNSHVIMPGQPLGSIYGYQVMGLWQAGQACDLTDPRPTLDCVPGELHIQDVNNDGRITPDDRKILGHADPKYFGGASNNLKFGPLSVDAYFTFSAGGKVVNASNAFLKNSTGALNERTEVLNRWTPTHTNTNIPRANSNRKTFLYSTLIEDGSYLRLQTLTFGLGIPKRYIPRAEGVRLYVTGQNVFTASHYSGFDPEVNSLNGSPSARGLDVGAYPRARVWNAGVNLSF